MRNITAVVPGDAAAGRYVSGLKTIAIGQL
jgi:hypothetical protein